MTGEEDRVPAVGWFQLRTFQGENGANLDRATPSTVPPPFPSVAACSQCRPQQEPCPWGGSPSKPLVPQLGGNLFLETSPVLQNSFTSKACGAGSRALARNAGAGGRKQTAAGVNGGNEHWKPSASCGLRAALTLTLVVKVQPLARCFAWLHRSVPGPGQALETQFLTFLPAGPNFATLGACPQHQPPPHPPGTTQGPLRLSPDTPCAA